MDENEDEFKFDSSDEPLNFWALAGKPQHQSLPNETAGEFLARINDPTKWLYGTEVRDAMLLGKDSTLYRYGHLARKLFFHYAGERYNPHTISIMNEVFVRTIIKDAIEYKVHGKMKNYDWETLNAFFAKIVGDLLDIDIPYDQARIDAGIKSEFRSPYHELDFLNPN